MAKKNTKLKWGGLIAAIVAVAAAITGATININIESDKVNASIIYSQEETPATIEGDQGEVYQTETINGEEIPTVEEVDGGMFQDRDTGLSVTTVDGQYSDLGWSEWYPTDTPEAFKNATLGHCVYANNYFGAQCVSLARVYWWSYADRDVSTCGTGMAKGMMNCAEQNAGDDFLIYWKADADGIQAGDWLVFEGGQYGHVGMALGPVSNGYAALLGENQGGRACEGGGAATNVINISIKNLIGFYRPKAYVKPEPTPEPTPEPEPTPTPIPVSGCVEWGVVRGDTMSKIMLECEGTVVYGEPMNAYARTWFSRNVKPGQSVYDGWNSSTGVGLYAGDWIDHKVNGE